MVQCWNACPTQAGLPDIVLAGLNVVTVRDGKGKF